MIVQKQWGWLLPIQIDHQQICIYPLVTKIGVIIAWGFIFIPANLSWINIWTDKPEKTLVDAATGRNLEETIQTDLFPKVLKNVCSSWFHAVERSQLNNYLGFYSFGMERLTPPPIAGLCSLVRLSLKALPWVCSLAFCSEILF